VSQPDRRPAISPWQNPVTRALRAGRVCVGACSIAFPCPAVAQISARAGFSFFYFDMEHSGLPIDAVEPICSAAKLAGITPIAGTSGIADFLISRPLDQGAMGVIVPHVSTRDEAALVVDACRYAPLGTRGLINMAPLTEFENADSAAWVAAANREVLVAVKVESARGIENVEQIAAVPGLDAILIGPGDLSASYELPGQTDHPRVQAAFARMLAACRQSGIAGGPHVGSPAAVREWADRGATFMSCGWDGALLLDASVAMAGGARDLLGERML
jgi:2-keto-3-deoxy-L-rhamnonate aldolase RhmA